MKRKTAALLTISLISCLALLLPARAVFLSAQAQDGGASSRSGGLADRLKVIRNEHAAADAAISPSDGDFAFPATDALPPSAPANMPAQIGQPAPLPMDGSRPLPGASPLRPAYEPKIRTAPAVDEPGGWLDEPAAGSFGDSPSTSPPADSHGDRLANPSYTASRDLRPETPRPLSQSSQCPALQVELSGPAATNVGEPAAYAFKVVNVSDSPARDVIVQIGIPAGLSPGRAAPSGGEVAQQPAAGGTQLVWRVGEVPARGERQLSLDVTPQQGGEFQFQIEWQIRPPGLTASVQAQQPRLEMSLAGPSDIPYGETAMLTVVLQNPGTGDAKEVELSVAAGTAPAVRQQIGTIPAGGRKEIPLELPAREAGKLQILATASASGGLKTEAQKQLNVRRARLQLTISGPTLKYAGTPATYEILVANAGDAEARGVSAAVSLPSAVKYSGGIDDAQPTQGGIRWSIGSLPPGAQREYRFHCDMTAGGEVVIEAAAQGAGDLSVRSTVKTRVEAVADLTMTVADPQGPRPVGKDAVYEIKVTNRGTSAASNVQVIAQFSEGIEPIAAEGQRADIVPGQALFRPIERIAAGQEITLRVIARPQGPGDHIFRAELRSTDPATRRVYEGNTRYFGDEAATGEEPAAGLSRRPAPPTALPR